MPAENDDDHDHEGHEDHEGHDHDHDHKDEPERVAVDPEVAAARRACLSATLESITIEDLNKHLSGSPPQVRQALTQRLSVRLDPKFIKGGAGRLIRTRLRTLAPDKQIEMAAELTAGIDQESAEFLGEEAFDTPTPADLDRLIDHLLITHAPVMIRAYLACTAAAEAPVADELDRLLADDPRVTPATA